MTPPYRPPIFKKENLDRSTQVDMGHFVDDFFKSSIRTISIKNKHNVQKMTENHFEFLRYDLLHAMNTRSATSILKNAARLRELKAKLNDRLRSSSDPRFIASFL